MITLTQQRAVILVPAGVGAEAEIEDRRKSLLRWFTQRGWILETERREDQRLAGRLLVKISFRFHRQAVN